MRIFMSFEAGFCYLGEVKRCDYCGKEYPDEALVCVIDGNSLPGNLKAMEKSGVAVPPPSIAPTNPDAVYPEYRWSARDGWKFLGMMLVLEVVWYVVTGALYRVAPQFYYWRWGPFGSVIMRCAYIALNVLTAAYFARTESWNSFFKAFGLDKKPSQYVWFGVAAALGFRLLAHIVHSLGWTSGYTSYEIRAFGTTHGPERYLFLFGLIAAAFLGRSGIPRVSV